MNVPWAVLKGFLDTRNVPVQWVDIEDHYWLTGVDGPFALACLLTKTSPAGADQQDFEDNYKAAGNISPSSNVITLLRPDSIALRPATLQFTGVKGTSTLHDKLLTSSTGQLAIRGGLLYMGVTTLGDTIGAQIIDKDNILGLGGTPQNPIIISDYIEDGEWSIMPTVVNTLTDASLSTSMPAGLYFRLIYNSDPTALANPTGIINLLKYEV